MLCQDCKLLTNDKQKDIKICGRCRAVKKADLVYLLLKHDKIYLTESNRNKTGAKQKLSNEDIANIQLAYKTDPKKNSYGNLAKRYWVSKSTIFNAVNKK